MDPEVCPKVMALVRVWHPVWHPALVPVQHQVCLLVLVQMWHPVCRREWLSAMSRMIRLRLPRSRLMGRPMVFQMVWGSG
ncbi:hypothetical protein D3C75_914410 [compost metagenome]